MDAVVPPRLTGRARKLVVAPIARVMSWSSRSADPSDLIVTIAAEDAHDFQDRLVEIAAPTLVIAGADDPFYTEALFRETADGIPGALLILYPGMGHPAHGKQFARDVLAFLGSEAERAKPTEGRAKAAGISAGRARRSLGQAALDARPPLCLLSLSSSSSSRSIPSVTPVSMPAWTIASRSSTD